MFWDETSPFPADMLKLGCYLRPSIDVGQVITKILTQNREVLLKSMHRTLAPDKSSDLEVLDAQEQLMNSMHEKLEFQVIPSDLG